MPASLAKGKVEYFLAAKNKAGQPAKLGDGDVKNPFVITFKPSAASSASGSSDSSKGTGPFGFTHNPLYRVLPSRPIVIRAQVVPGSADGQMPERVAVLWRGNDAKDQISDMASDATGGYGGFMAELPAQEEGAVYYQVIACDSGASKCAADTGSKHKWHAAAIGAQPGSAQPTPIDAVSSKAPAALAE